VSTGCGSVLIVDDDASFRAFVSSILARAGHATLEAAQEKPRSRPCTPNDRLSFSLTFHCPASVGLRSAASFANSTAISSRSSLSREKEPTRVAARLHYSSVATIT
jgi:hypothetical protein